MDVTLAFKLLFSAILLLAAYSDARRFLIPNIYPLALVVLFVAALLLGFPFPPPLWSLMLHFGAALMIGMLLFHFGWLGGGDAKLYAATAMWFPFQSGVWLFFVTTLAGVLVVIVSVTGRIVRGTAGRGAVGKRLADRRIAYGVAIAVGGIASIFWTYR